MKWKYVLLGLLLLLILVPTVLYVGSLDWQRKHSQRVAELPLFSPKVDSGSYRLPVGSYEYLVRVAGMQHQNAPGLILLHGFPESSIMWGALAKRAAREGFRVVAFDQRGYSPGARPADTCQYALTRLAKDVTDVADRLGFKTFHLVGHDWGAAVGWVVTMNQPQRVDSWTALSIPHIGVFFDGVVNDTTQQKRSGYFSFFQKPLLPEFLLTYNGQKSLKNLLAKLPQAHHDEYLSILAEPGALTAALNWYRAMDVPRFVKSRQFMKVITRPTLFIWGSQDQVIAESVIARQTAYVRPLYLEVKMEAGHALMQEKEVEVVESIISHLKSHRVDTVSTVKQ